MSADASVSTVAAVGSAPLLGGAGSGGGPVPGLPGASTATPVGPVAPAQPSADVLQRAATQVVQSLPGPSRFDFSFDKQSGMTIVRVYNSSTGELVRQIPAEVVVHLAQLMRQQQANPALLDVTA